MRCPTCQYDNPDGTPFCAECGTRLSATGATAGGPSTGLLPQQTVLQDRYVINSKLGQGGMGAVYRAADRRLSTVTWAIKEMSQSAIAGPQERQQAREAFRHEAEMLAALNHPNLPRVTDHFEQDGKAYLVMEFVPGETLLSYLAREGLPQPLDRVLDWASQLCDALDYLHGQNPPIIFRDLKPANIMLTPGGQIKLIDFGIARLFKPGQAKDTLAFGTVGYSAPEQYGKGQTDARADVYALGVLLHQMLTGYDPTLTPFRLSPASQVNPRLPSGVSDVLAIATDNEPERRFASVRALRQALLSAAGQPSVPPALSYARQSDAMHARPASQPFAQAGSQPFSQPISQPGGVPSATTTLANLSRLIGIGSLALMGLATIMVALGAATGRSDSALSGFGYPLAFLPFATGPAAAVLGIVALVRPQTLETTRGRRDAIVGIATGAATVLLCCAIGVMAGIIGGTKG